MGTRTRVKTEKAPAPKSRIPVFSSIEEEAEFWDTHDVTDYWDEMKPAKVRFAKNLSQGMTIRLDLDTTIKLRSEAAKKGIGPTTLVRMWVIERLQQERRGKPSSRATPHRATRTRRAG